MGTLMVETQKCSFPVWDEGGNVCVMMNKRPRAGEERMT